MKKKIRKFLDLDLTQRPLAYEPCMLPLRHGDILLIKTRFYNSRAPQICFWNVWDPKIDKIRLRPYVYMYTMHITLMNYAYSFNRHSKSDISRNIATYNQGAEKGGSDGLIFS